MFGAQREWFFHMAVVNRRVFQGAQSSAQEGEETGESLCASLRKPQNGPGIIKDLINRRFSFELKNVMVQFLCLFLFKYVRILASTTIIIPLHNCSSILLHRQATFLGFLLFGFSGLCFSQSNNPMFQSLLGPTFILFAF